MFKTIIKNIKICLSDPTYIEAILTGILILFVAGILLIAGCSDDPVPKKLVSDIPDKSSLVLEPFKKILSFNTTKDLLEVINMGEYIQEDIAPIIKGTIVINDTTLILNGRQSYDPVGRKVYYNFTINGKKVCSCRYGEFELDTTKDLTLYFEAYVKKDGVDEADQYNIGTSFYKQLAYAQAMAKESPIGK